MFSEIKKPISREKVITSKMCLGRETFTNYLSISGVILTIILIVQSKFALAEINEQPKLNTLPIAVTKESNGSDSVPLTHSTSADAENDIAMKQFVKQIKDIIFKQRKEGNGTNNQTRQAFDVDADWLEMSRDKGYHDGPFGLSNKPDTKHEVTHRNSGNKVKATDYFVNSPVSFPRKSILESQPDPRGTSSKKPFATKYIIKQLLHSKNMPTVSFEVNSNNTMFIFEVDEKEKSRYFISVVVERMNCRTDDKNVANSPKLLIQGEEAEISICQTFNNSATNYQSVDYLTSGNKFVSIIGIGSWSNASANLVASVYTEVSHSCNYCPDGHFCCGRKDTACKMTLMSPGKYTNKEVTSLIKREQPYRCVPKQDASGRSLICNGHPNCGFHCNVDEQSASCLNPKVDNDDENENSENCPGYYCRDYQQQDGFVITLLLLIIICVFLPVIILLFFCGKRDVRRDFGRRASGRCPVLLEIIFCPFSISADDDPSSTGTAASTSTGIQRQRGTTQQSPPPQSRAGGNARQNIRRATVPVDTRRGASSGLDNQGFFEDLPPSYSECCNDKVTFPNPALADTHGTESETAATLTLVEQPSSRNRQQTVTTSMSSAPSRPNPADFVDVMIRTNETSQ